MDIPGACAIMSAAVCFVLALQWGGTTKPWNSADVIGCLVGFGLLIGLVAVIEYYAGERALLIGRILKTRLMIGMCAYIFCAASIFFCLLYYLPIYFQTTRNASPQQSGIDNIPLVLSAGLASLVAGGAITATGHFIPVMVIGSCLTAIGAGLIHSLKVGSSSSHWIGYQIILGVGIGSIFQIPATVAQSSVPTEDLAAASAIVLFFQTIGGAIWVSSAQAGFANRLLGGLPTHTPTVNPATVLAAGASELRKLFTPEQVTGIVEAYMHGLRICLGFRAEIPED
jgi:MFS transporter, DHA2 family, glioxin efflux transporter